MKNKNAIKSKQSVFFIHFCHKLNSSLFCIIHNFDLSSIGIIFIRYRYVAIGVYSNMESVLASSLKLLLVLTSSHKLVSAQKVVSAHLFIKLIYTLKGHKEATFKALSHCGAPWPSLCISEQHLVVHGPGSQLLA